MMERQVTESKPVKQKPVQGVRRVPGAQLIVKRAVLVAREKGLSLDPEDLPDRVGWVLDANARLKRRCEQERLLRRWEVKLLWASFCRSSADRFKLRQRLGRLSMSRTAAEANHLVTQGLLRRSQRAVRRAHYVLVPGALLAGVGLGALLEHFEVFL